MRELSEAEEWIDNHKRSVKVTVDKEDTWVTITGMGRIKPMGYSFQDVVYLLTEAITSTTVNRDMAEKRLALFKKVDLSYFTSRQLDIVESLLNALENILQEIVDTE